MSFSLYGGGNYGELKDFADGLKMFACGQKTFQMKRKAEFVLTKSIAHYTSQAKCGLCEAFRPRGKTELYKEGNKHQLFGMPYGEIS